MIQKKKICIAGATGFVGLELIKKIYFHPYVEIKYLFVKESIEDDIYKSLPKNIKNLPSLKKIDSKSISECDVFFSALPHAEIFKIVNEVYNLNPNTVIIDLSADFRLPNVTEYEKWYKVKHDSIQLQKSAVYGLSEIYRDKIKKANVISCPGCYPTSILLPLIPLLEKNMIDESEIIADSKSGYSGAGKKIYDQKLYPNIDENLAIYGVGHHRHMPEIDFYLSQFSKQKIQISFTPHLIPTFRGILSTIYIKSKKNIKDLSNCLMDKYNDEFFVEIIENKMINTNNVINTNKCNIAIYKNRSENNYIISSSIDNLLKGASGQAIQNFNIRFNFNENLGLI